MLFLLSAKDWIKDHKKLIEPKDYILLDATDSQETGMTKFSNAVTMDNFCVPSKLLAAMSQDLDDEFMDIRNVEELEKNFFRGGEFKTSVLATLSTYLRADTDINVFIVVRNKSFKYYRKRFISEFCRIFPDIDPLLKIYKHDDRPKFVKLAEEILPNSDRNVLIKELVKAEKKMEEEMRHTKKKKKKGKKKDTKGWGLLGKEFKDLK